MCKLRTGGLFQFGHFGVYCRVFVKQVVEFQKIGFIGEDLLHPHGPLLVPGARQAKRFVPGRQLDGTGARLFGKCDGQHFDQNSVNIVFRLLFGKAERIHLNPISESAIFCIFHAVAVPANLIPKIHECAHFAHFGHKSDTGIHEK